MMRRVERVGLVLAAGVILIGSGSAFAATLGQEQGWNDLIRRGTYALDSNQYWQAEPLLKEAVESAKGFGDSDLRYARALDELGRMYTIRGRFGEAEKYLEQAYTVKQRALGKADGTIIPSMGEMIQFYLTYGTRQKAGMLTNEMLAFVEGKIEEALTPPETSVKFKKGAALEGFVGAADSSLHPTMDWALACDKAADAYKQRGEWNMADRLYKAALDVKSNIVGKEHLALALSYDCVGSVCMERGDTREAASYLKDALRVSQRATVLNATQMYSRIDKYAKVLIKEGKYGEAESLYLHAQNMWGADPEKDAERARAAFALGCLYCDQKKFAQAEPTLRRALRLAEHAHGPQSANIVPYLEKYAYALYYLGRKPEQERLKARAQAIAGVM